MLAYYSMTATRCDNLEQTLKEDLLPLVQKPGQYLGLEHGAARKDWDAAKSRMALIYPDLYELGMSNFGTKILYNIVNSHPDYLCDRAFAPMQDMEALLKEKNIPLWAWESYRALNEFDFLGFSLGYELCYTNILTILDLAQIPFRSKDRREDDPFIFAGGPAVHNPEPMAEFFDFFLIGDGEEVILEIQDVIANEITSSQAPRDDSVIASKNVIASAAKQSLNNSVIASEAKQSLNNSVIASAAKQSLSREEKLFKLSQIPGVYVPRFYKPDPDENYLPKAIKDGVPARVRKRVAQLNDLNQPTSGPVPHIGTVQDKQTMEIRRGCDRGCRFCQVGYVYLPVRERSPEDLLRLSTEAIKNTGYDSYTMLSLSASDYTCLTDAAKMMNDSHATNGVSLSMPSQRADRFDVELASEVQKVRKSGMTFAPEAGTEKMRRIINKGLNQEEIYKAIRGSYQAGWSHIKLYYMIGLPFEEDSDLDGIIDTLTWAVNMAKETKKTDREQVKAAKERGEKTSGKARRDIEITCTISTFVPKTFTAFQYYAQCSQAEFKRKQDYLKQALKERKIDRFVKLNCTEPKIALLESVLSRGDRRWGDVVETVWRAGARMDSWSENFNLEIWKEAAAKHGMDFEEEVSIDRSYGLGLSEDYSTRKQEIKELSKKKFCWDVLDLGFTEEFFAHEWEQAILAAETKACTENQCHACGVCFNLDTANVVTENRSKNNPFVTEIDAEKRKKSCSQAYDLIASSALDRKQEKDQAENKGTISASPYSNQPSLVVKHYDAAQKLRLVITKTGDYKFIGHLDFQRIVERAIRRTGLPVVHTKGFNQRIKLKWGNALPLFMESKWEYLEIELAEAQENLETLKENLNAQLPKQAMISNVELISTDDKSSINKVLEVTYTAKLNNSEIDLQKIDIPVQFSEQVEKMKILSSNEIMFSTKAQLKIATLLDDLVPAAKWNVCKEKQVLKQTALV